MTVKEIVEKWLKANGYDGLWNADGECACILGDIGPCLPSECFGDCQPGYLRPCPQTTCGEHRFHIGKEKHRGGFAAQILEEERARHKKDDQKTPEGQVVHDPPP